MWRKDEKNIIKQLLQELIPASEDYNIPSAGLDSVINYLENKVKEDLNFRKLFNSGILKVNDLLISKAKNINSLNSKEKIVVLKNIEDEEPLFFKEFLKHVYMGYYSEPSIRPFFGVSFNPPHPSGYEVPEEEPDLIENLVKPVKKRGICYRQC